MFMAFFLNQDLVNRGRRALVALLLLLTALAPLASLRAEEKKKESCTNHKLGEGADYEAIKVSKARCEASLDQLHEGHKEAGAVKGKLKEATSSFDKFTAGAVDTKSSIEQARAMMQKSVTELETGKGSLGEILKKIGKVQEVSTDQYQALVAKEAKLASEMRQDENLRKHITENANATLIPQLNQVKGIDTHFAKQRTQQLELALEQVKKKTAELDEKVKKKVSAISDHRSAMKDQDAVRKGAGTLGKEIKEEQAKIDSSISGLKQKMAELEKVKLGEANDPAKKDEQKKEGETAKGNEPSKTDPTAKSGASGEGSKPETQAEKDFKKAAGESDGKSAIEAGKDIGKKKDGYLEGNETRTGIHTANEQIEASQKNKEDLEKSTKDLGGASGVARDAKAHVKKLDEIDKELSALPRFDTGNPPEKAKELIEQRKMITDSLEAQPALKAEAQRLGVSTRERKLTDGTDDIYDPNDFYSDPGTGVATRTREASQQRYAAESSTAEAAKLVDSDGYEKAVESGQASRLAAYDKDIEKSVQSKQDFEEGVKNAESRAQTRSAILTALTASEGATLGPDAFVVTKEDIIASDTGTIASKNNVGTGIASQRLNEQGLSELARGVSAQNASDRLTDAVMLPVSVAPGGGFVDLYRADAASKQADSDMRASGYDYRTVDHAKEKQSERTMAVYGAVAEVGGGAALTAVGKSAKVAGGGFMKAADWAVGAERIGATEVITHSPANEIIAKSVVADTGRAASRETPTIAATLGNTVDNYADDSFRGTVKSYAMPEGTGGGSARGSFGSYTTAKVPEPALVNTIEAPMSATKLVDDIPTGKTVNNFETVNPATAPVATAKTISPPGNAARLVDNYEPVAPTRMGIDNAPRIQAPPTTVARKGDAADNVIDLNSRRKPAPERAVNTPAPKREVPSNDNFSPNRQPARQVANGGWVDNAISEGAEFTGGVAKAFAPAAQTMAAQAQTASRAAANAASAAPVARAANSVSSSGVARASSAVPASPRGSVFDGAPAQISGSTYGSSGRVLTAPAKSAATRAAEASRTAGVSALKKQGMTEAAAKNLLEQPNPASVRAQVFNDPSLANLSRGHRSQLSDQANVYRQQYQAARSAAAPATPTIAPPSSTGRSLASVSDDLGNPGASSGRRLAPARASKQADDYAYEAYGNAPTPQGSALREMASSSRRPARAEADEAVGPAGRLQKNDDAFKEASALADDASDLTLAKAGKEAPAAAAAESVAVKNADNGAAKAVQEADDLAAKSAREAEEVSPPAARSAAAEEAKAESLLAKGAKEAEKPAPLKDPLDEVLAYEKNALDDPKMPTAPAKAPTEEKIKEALDRVSLKGEVRKGDRELADRFLAARKLDEMDPNTPFWKRQERDRLRRIVDDSGADVDDVSRRLAADRKNPELQSELLLKSEKYARDQQRLMESLGLYNNQVRFLDTVTYGDKVIPARWVLESTGATGATANKALAGTLKNSNGRIGLRIDPVANRFYGSAAHFDPNNGFLVFDKVASKMARIEPNSTILHEIGHAVRWDKDEMFKAALKNPNATPEELAKLRSASTYRGQSFAGNGRSLKTTNRTYDSGYSMDEMRVAAQDTIRKRRFSREKDFIERVKGEGALTDEYRAFKHSDVQSYEKRAYAMASDVEQHLKTLSRKAEGAQIVRDQAGELRLKFADGSEHYAEYAAGQYRVMVPYYQNGERAGSWMMELSNVGKGVDRSIAGSMKREIDQGIREAQGTKRALERSSGLDAETLARDVDRKLAGQGQLRSGRIPGEAVDRAMDEAFFNPWQRIRPEAVEGAELSNGAVKGAAKGAGDAKDAFKSTAKGADATGASRKPGLVERLFGKPDMSKPPRADQKAFATWLKDAYTPKELDKWNFVKQGQINRARDSIERRQSALNDLIDKSSGRSLTKAEEATILDESRKLAREQKALLDKIGRPHNEVMKAPAGEWGGQWVPERYVLKSVRPTPEEIAADPKWTKLGSSGNKSINTFVKNTGGKADVIIDPVLIRSTGTAGMWDPSNKALIFQKIESTTPKLESNLVYMHEIRHAKRNIDQAALEGKLAQFSRAESELVGRTDNELLAMAEKQGKKYDLDKHEIGENFAGLKARRDEAERFAGEEIDDLERKLAKDQLNGRFRANEGKTISNFDGYERFMSLDETTTYAREVTQASRMAEHRQFIEYALGKQAVPENLAKRSNLAILQDSVEGTDAAQRAARENLNLAKKSVERAEAVGNDGATRIFETPTGAELRIKNTGGMLEAQIPLVKHGEDIGTYTFKVPAPDARLLTDAEMLERVNQGIAKQQAEVKGTVKSAQGGIKAIEEVVKTDAALARKAADDDFISSSAPEASGASRSPSAPAAPPVKPGTPQASAKDAALIDSTKKEGWFSRFFKRVKGEPVPTPEAKQKAQELANLYRKQELDPNRPPELQKEIDDLRASVGEHEKSLESVYANWKKNPTDAAVSKELTDLTEKLAKEQVELSKKIGRPDVEPVFVKGETVGGKVYPDRYVVHSKNVYAETDDLARSKLFADKGRGVTADPAIEKFIYNTQGEVKLAIDPVGLKVRKAGGTWLGTTNTITLPKLETKAAKVAGGHAVLHEIDHGARDFAEEATRMAAREQRLIAQGDRSIYLRGMTDDEIRAEVKSSFPHLSDKEMDDIVAVNAARRDRSDQAYREYFSGGTDPSRYDQAVPRSTFEGRFVADKGERLGHFKKLYDRHYSLDEVRTYGRDQIQALSAKEQATFIERTLGAEAVPDELKALARKGDKVEEYFQYTKEARDRLQEVKDTVNNLEFVDRKAGWTFRTPQGDLVNVRYNGSMLSARLPLYRDGKKVGSFVMERPKLGANFKSDDIKKILGAELDRNLKEVDTAEKAVIARRDRDNRWLSYGQKKPSAAVAAASPNFVIVPNTPASAASSSQLSRVQRKAAGVAGTVGLMVGAEGLKDLISPKPKEDFPTLLSGMNPTQEGMEESMGTRLPASWTMRDNPRRTPGEELSPGAFRPDARLLSKADFKDPLPTGGQKKAKPGEGGGGPGSGSGPGSGGNQTPGGQKLREMEKGPGRIGGDLGPVDSGGGNTTPPPVPTTGGGENTPKGGSSMSMTDGLLIGGAVLAAGGAAAYMLTKKKSNKGNNLELQAALLAQQQKQAAEAASATATETATESSVTTVTRTENFSDPSTSTATGSSTGTATATATATSTATSTSTSSGTASLNGGTIRATNIPASTFAGATLAPIFVQLYNKDGSMASVSGLSVRIRCVQPSPCSMKAPSSVVSSVNGKVSFERLSFSSAHEAAVLRFEADGLAPVATPPIRVSKFKGEGDRPAGQVRRGSSDARQ